MNDVRFVSEVDDILYGHLQACIFMFHIDKKVPRTCKVKVVLVAYLLRSFFCLLSLSIEMNDCEMDMYVLFCYSFRAFRKV